MAKMYPDTPVNSDEEFDVLSTQDDSQALSDCVYDEEYYCDVVVVRIEKTLFKIPLSVLAQSEYVKESYLVQRSGVCGIGNDTPLYLDNYGPHEFRLLLRVLLPLRHGLSLHLSADESMSLLNIATGLEFPTVRDVAIYQLTPYARSDPILKIIAAKKYGVQGWLLPAVNSLAQRDESLGQDDVERLAALGDAKDVMKLVLCIAKVRECFVARSQPISLAADYHPLDTKCYESHACSYHQISTPCAGYASLITRASYDFTPHICDIFGISPPGEPASPISSTHTSYERENSKQVTWGKEDAKNSSVDAAAQRHSVDQNHIAGAGTQEMNEGDVGHLDSEGDALKRQRMEDREAVKKHAEEEDIAVLERERERQQEATAAAAEAEATKLRKQEAAARKRHRKLERKNREGEEAEAKSLTDEWEAFYKAKEEVEVERVRLAEEKRKADKEAVAVAEAARIAEEKRVVDEEAQRQRLADQQFREKAAKAGELHRLKEINKQRLVDQKRKAEEEAETTRLALEVKQKAEEEKKRQAEEAKQRAEEEATEQAQQALEAAAAQAASAESHNVKLDADSLLEWGTPSKKKALRAKVTTAAQRKKEAEPAEIAATLEISLPQALIGGTSLAGTPVPSTSIDTSSPPISNPLVGSRPGSPHPPSRTSSPAPFHPSRVSSIAPQQTSKGEANAPVVSPILSTQDQAKIDVAQAAVADAEKALASAQATAKPLKEASEADERAAANLELEGANNPVKKVRASAARRKATASAKAAVPVLRALGKAESQHAEAVKKLEELKATLSPVATPAAVDELVTNLRPPCVDAT